MHTPNPEARSGSSSFESRLPEHSVITLKPDYKPVIADAISRYEERLTAQETRIRTSRVFQKYVDEPSLAEERHVKMYEWTAPTRYKLALARALFYDGSVDAPKLRNRFWAEFGWVDERQWINACDVIAAYCEGRNPELS